MKRFHLGLAVFIFIAASFVATNDVHAAASSVGAEGLPEASVRQSADDRIADYTLALTLFTAVVAFATVGLIWATHTLGVRADRGMRVLERAYVAVSIVRTDIRRLLEITNAGDFYNPTVSVRLTNHGKTPAYLVDGEAWLRIREDEPRAHWGGIELEFDRSVIGAGEVWPSPDGPPISRKVQQSFKLADLQNIKAGRASLMFLGHVVYEDIWGNRYKEVFWAPLSVGRKRFEMQRREEIIRKPQEKARS